MDDHHFWYTPQNKSGMASRQKEWEDMRRKMQTEIELFSKEAAGDSPRDWSNICRPKTGNAMIIKNF